MNELKVFTNEECGEIRAMKRDGEAWFVAVDVCNALDTIRRALISFGSC